MTDILITLLIIAAGLWLTGNLFTYPLQQLFILRPEKLPQDFEFYFSSPFEEVFLDAPDGGRINGLHFRDSNKKAKGVVLYFHGNAENLERWGNLYMDFVPEGWDFFIIDFRGYGKSTGRLTAKNFTDDGLLCWNYLLKFYAPEEIIIYGRSMGSSVASALAAKVKAKMLILETPFSSIPDLFYTYYTFLPRIFLFKFNFPNKNLIKDLSYPVYVFHGTKDWVIPYNCALKLKPSLKETVEFITIKGGHHNDLSKFEGYRLKMKELLSR